MDREPDVALSMTACGSPVYRIMLPDISSKLMASWVMLSTVATSHALLKIMLW